MMWVENHSKVKQLSLCPSAPHLPD